MQLEVGEIYEGKVTGITKFGAFVSFENGQTGMVHISEVSSTYVNEIKDYLTEGQSVKVRVLGITDQGKVSLSIKKAQENQTTSPRPNRAGAKFDNSRRRTNFSQQQRRFEPKPQVPARPGDYEWQQKRAEGGNFEDMMSRFKQSSDEKISDLKRGTETRRGYSKRGQQK